MRRVVSLFLPHWSTDRLRRKTVKSPPDGGHLSGAAPLVTAIPDHGRRIVASLDAGARALGVAPGMTVTKARSFAPGLQVVDAEPEADLEGLRRLALWAGGRYAPLVAPDPPDGIWLDISGCAALFGSERALLKGLHRRAGRSPNASGGNCTAGSIRRWASCRSRSSRSSPRCCRGRAGGFWSRSRPRRPSRK